MNLQLIGVYILVKMRVAHNNFSAVKVNPSSLKVGQVCAKTTYRSYSMYDYYYITVNTVIKI